MTGQTKRQWVVVVFIVASAICLLLIVSNSGPSAKAQSQLQNESGIMVIPVQLKRDSFGLAMVDTIGQTLWVYELSSRGPARNRLKLLAARNWQYDRLLQNYNTAEPKPAQVRMLLEELAEKQAEPSEEKPEQTDINIPADDNTPQDANVPETAEPDDGNNPGETGG